MDIIAMKQDILSQQLRDIKDEHITEKNLKYERKMLLKNQKGIH